MSSVVSRIAKLEKELNALKVELNSSEVKPEVKTEVKPEVKPKKIEDCTTMKQLDKFSVIELKEWLKKKKINVKKVAAKHKEDFVKIVWQEISDDYESDYSTESEPEEDEWEYYYE